jgi:hypothetical protein
MEFGPEDIVEFGLYYLPSLVLAAATSVAILAAIIFGRRLRPIFAHLTGFGVCLVTGPLVSWVIYFVSTSEFTSTLVLLNSESSEVAEWSYFSRFKPQVATLDTAVGLAVDEGQEPNVRFYASCLIAEMLATNDDAVSVKVLNEVKGAPIIGTQFFGGNALTDKFYVPGHDQVHLPVQDIVERRLRELRHKTRT